MNKRWTILLTLVLLALLIAGTGSTVAAQGPEQGPVAAVSAGPDGVNWQPQVSSAGAVLTVSGPDGSIFRQEYGASSSPSFGLLNPDGSARPDGIYTYELSVIPSLDPADKAALAAVADSADRAAVVERLIREGRLPGEPLVLAGSFAIQAGAIVVVDASETASVESPLQLENGILDQVILDDLIVDGSACIGFDCVNGESFGFDTLRLKENNLRIKFLDTSTSASFPTNDWELTANDTSNGGSERFSITDITNGRTPFTVVANAPSNSLYVHSSGRIGLRTSVPVVELHIKDGDSPTVRLEQDGSSGFTPYTWDVAGNEANFFIRDVTNGSKLPFRMRPGAPSDSLYVAANGDVGMGTNNPVGPLEVRRSGRTLLRLDTTGNLTLDGVLIQTSDLNVKANINAVSGQEVLARLAELPIATWNFSAEDAAVRHMGPMAQDFYAAFELGLDERHIAAVDVNGVALAAIQGLHQLLQERDAQIAELQQQNADLEARLQALERIVNSLGGE
jgi:hypothetical protein